MPKEKDFENRTEKSIQKEPVAISDREPEKRKHYLDELHDHPFGDRILASTQEKRHDYPVDDKEDLRGPLSKNRIKRMKEEDESEQRLRKLTENFEGYTLKELLDRESGEESIDIEDEELDVLLNYRIDRYLRQLGKDNLDILKENKTLDNLITKYGNNTGIEAQIIDEFNEVWENDYFQKKLQKRLAK